MQNKKHFGVPIRLRGDPKFAIGWLFIRHRQMLLEFDPGVSRKVIDDLFPGAEVIVEEKEHRGNRELVIRARIVGFWWAPNG